MRQCAEIQDIAVHRRGLVSSPDGLGAPPPTGLTVRYAITCRPSGALGYLVHAAFYKHVAPLGLSAAKIARHGVHRRGLVSSPDGLGAPPPTGLTVRYAITCRPSGALGVWCMPRSINMSPRWG